jgi:hypothetical protein
MRYPDLSPPTTQEITAALQRMRTPGLKPAATTLQLTGVVLSSDLAKELLHRIAASVTRGESLPASDVIFSVGLGAFAAGMNAALVIEEVRAIEASRWEHPICRGCWNQQFPEREPFRIIQAHAEPATCCWCRDVTREGIGVRIDPAMVPCQGLGHGARPAA